ncbi:HAMP domain-containing sensor histidine kinase [Paracoccus sp. MC1862]|uniref:sensor histidine kinase n=1 Tax=Paracoccus sp. MC1862 TaxID=2760307 RepID=UPI001601F51D|nr:ATP-binding protein [Paracoccus sp. MC1862]MBB1498119.1 sensor histidine kinase N-terminal domain-containing protein [Paracoccus sp. MC1862]QQO46199.1 sensor histidine kinase N-terminal domain-containing protein [Paracoccus sp. MC1862]
MRGPASLQGRLSLWLTLGAVLLWAVAAAWTAVHLRHEMDEVFDSALEEAAQRLLPLAVRDIIAREKDDSPDQGVATLREHDEYFTYVVRDAEGQVLLRSHRADLGVFPPFSGMGFADTATHRVYSDAALRGTITISVAEPLAHRWDVAREALIGLALPLTLIVPASLFGVWAAVRAAMAPIRRFRAGIEARGGGDLSPIPAEGLPSELQPNARAVNLLLDRLRRALEAERSFTANSAHELRTPVAGALAQVQRLIVEAPDEDTRSRARQVEAALQRLARLSEKLMQLARAEGGRLQAEAPVDLAPILRMLVADMGRGDGHRIELTLPDAGVRASIDPDAFAILARNLIENALHHDAQDAPVQVSLSPKGVLRVVNTGPVVPADVLGRLARPFERGPTDAHGSGLGLAIVAAIAAGTGGRLDLISPATGRADGFEARFSMSRAEMR